MRSTNGDLKHNVADKTFREDLFDRLSAFPLRIPPLRERPPDIVPPARHFLRRIAAGRDLSVSDEALTLMKG